MSWTILTKMYIKYIFFSYWDKNVAHLLRFHRYLRKKNFLASYDTIPFTKCRIRVSNYLKRMFSTKKNYWIPSIFNNSFKTNYKRQGHPRNCSSSICTFDNCEIQFKNEIHLWFSCYMCYCISTNICCWSTGCHQVRSEFYIESTLEQWISFMSLLLACGNFEK